MSSLTDHFSSEEFSSHDGEDTPPEILPVLRALCRQLEVIRVAWKAPVIVVSGWRSKAWNDRVGGAKASRHLTGEAADIRPVTLGILPEFNGMIERLLVSGKLPNVGGIGYYPARWVHLDLRPRKPDGALARWRGRGVGSEQPA